MRTWKFPFSLLVKYKFNHNTDKKGVIDACIRAIAPIIA